MSFAAGAATFNSCNKQGSIAYFTEHLRTNPGDYNALLWRAKAHGIVGNAQEALNDIQHAESVSSGVKRAVAAGMYVLHSTNNLEQFGEIAEKTVQTYGNEWTAWNQLAQYHSMNNDEEKAIQCWEKALMLAAENQEKKDPQICWINFRIGNTCLKKGDIATAKGYYRDAIQSCETHTVSHIHLCECNILQGNLQEARDNFTTATKLNPNLSSSFFKTDNFDVYLQSKLTKHMETFTLEHAQGANQVKASKVCSGVSTSGGRSGNGGDGGGSGSGGDSSDDDGDVSATWKKLQKESPCIKRYGSHKYVQSKCGKFWYSRDTARHGGAQFKRYEDTGSTLRFKDSLDSKLNPISGKHESRANTVIQKSKMTGVKGK